ncbi:MAG: GGDEF domain-containing protein [Betaproteobacteria bacterium]
MRDIIRSSFRTTAGTLRKDQFDDARLDLIRRLVDQIGRSLATLRFQQQLRDQSFRDPPTGLFNRRYLETTIEKDVSRADCQHQTIGLVMIDIDHFKMTNDRYGHDAGDIILRSVSDTLHGHSRTEDITCRYGGEEFLLVFPGASLIVACERTETLRQAVEKIATVLKDGTTITGTTISLGVAAYPMHGGNWRAAVGLADQALYRAKDQGRNRVLVADAVPVGETQLPEIEATGS